MAAPALGAEHGPLMPLFYLLPGAEHGKTCAAAVPRALDTAVRDGRIKRGDLLLLEAVGGGFSWVGIEDCEMQSIDGFVAPYKDKGRNAVAINAGAHKNKYAASTKVFRITSYNVCYTKLLRIFRERMQNHHLREFYRLSGYLIQFELHRLLEQVHF